MRPLIFLAFAPLVLAIARHSPGRADSAGVSTSRAPSPAVRMSSPGQPGDRLLLRVAGTAATARILPSRAPLADDVDRILIASRAGLAKIAYSFNPDDDLAAIRRAGFTHVLVSYLQGAPDAEQRRKLDDCRSHGLKLIYRLVDLVDRSRRGGSDEPIRHAVLLLRDHPALAGWQTFEETNRPPADQVAVYRKIKSWDPRHPILTVLTNEYSPGWYRRTYADEAQDMVLIDFYPYKRTYDGWPYIRGTMRALRAAQKRPVPIIPVIQASASSHVASAEDTLWPPRGGLEKQVNFWWSCGADAGVAFWLWRGSKEYPFVGVADPAAPAWALPETTALLRRIPDGDLDGRVTISSVPTVRVRTPTINYLKNSGFEDGLVGWGGYNEAPVLTDEAHTGHQAARLANSGPAKAIGVGQQTDLLVPPNGSVTLSAYYRVVRETSKLQWLIATSAYPGFGAAAFLEGKERLPAGDWHRASISITNTTGAPQRLKGVSILSNGFTGEVLLDDLQLERGPEATSYTIDRAATRASRLRFIPGRHPGRAAGMTATGAWQLSAAGTLEAPPDADQYACLVSVERSSARGTGAAGVELRLRCDTQRSDPYGWSGTLELAEGDSIRCRLPIALTPGQPFRWSLAWAPSGEWKVSFAPVGYRPAVASAPAVSSAAGVQAVSLGSAPDGSHPVNGRVGDAVLTTGKRALRDDAPSPSERHR